MYGIYCQVHSLIFCVLETALRAFAKPVHIPALANCTAPEATTVAGAVIYYTVSER